MWTFIMFLMYEKMHIVTLFFSNCYDQECMREHVRGMVCVRWSNMVVVVDCDSNLIATMGFYQFFVTSLGIKTVHVL
jgi:hypothetical protein